MTRRNVLRRFLLLLLTAAFLAVSVSCSGKEGDDGVQIDISDPVGGSSIVTADDLVAFVEKGEGNTAILQNNIDLDRDMLKLTRTRGDFTIEGNGFTITGSGDCVIRLEDKMKLTLNDVTIVGGYDGIGALGDCTISGNNATVKGVANAANCIGLLTIGNKSNLTFLAQEGSGAIARGVTLSEGALLNASGGMGGITSTDGDVTLTASSYLNAQTDKNYNALQCARTLVLMDGCTLKVTNNDLYHGAEANTLSVEGAVTIEASGGEKGAGLFIYTLNDDVRILGSCIPEARFENGNGNIMFVDSIEDLATPTPEPTETPED